MLKTTCGKHRTEGYALAGAGVWICRGCGAPEAHHETICETLDRKKAEAARGGAEA